ncbi:MAG: MFS transporter [Nitrososphaerota archaeon]|nr:MFS transporter [Nitrososphaerota archaeon]MDG6938926.1 MFS transporter [Nitrososphaerota archaeon]
MTSEIGYSPSEKVRTYAGALVGFMFDGTDFLIISYVLLPLVLYFHTNIATISFTVTLVNIGSVIGGILFGWMADSLGRRNMLIFTVLVYGSFTVLTGFVDSIWQLWLLRFLTGLGLGGEWGIGSSMVNEAWSEKARGTAGGLLQSMFFAGQLIGIFVAGYSLAQYGTMTGWRIAFVISGAISLLLLLLRFLMPESKVWLGYRERKAKGELPPGYDTRQSFVQIFSKDVRRWTFFGTLMASAYLFFSSSFIVFSTALFLAAKVPPLAITTMIVFGAVAGMAGQILNGFLADRVGRKAGAVLFGIIGILTTATFYYTVVQRASFVSIFAYPLFYASVAQYFAQGFNGNWPTWLGELFPTKMRSTASNFLFMVGRILGSGLAAIFVPLSVGFGGLGVAMAVGAMIGAVVMTLAALGLKETKGTKITPL